MNDPIRRTLEHYERSAESFWEGTRHHDVSQNIEALLSSIEGKAPFRILDFGCGPGRDLAAWKALGHQAIGLDGCTRFVDMAKENSGCEVWHQDFLALDLPRAHFDGVFANASLFHVPSKDLPRVLRELRACLRSGGALVCSNPLGHGEEGFSHERYGCFFDLDRWRQLAEGAGFIELGHYYRAERWIVMKLRAP